ncbi:MAG: hypothetical protein RBT80_20270 [Candidatus Vecturithrix sp.]|jgi:mRNA interferase MazF|nr:hypothetical protein [Candidatus Vecturithrix sp.]
MPEPKRGEVWLVDLGLAAKVCPCLVLNIPPQESERALCTLVAHTTSPRGTRFEVAVHAAFLRSGVFVLPDVTTTKPTLGANREYFSVIRKRT